MAEQLQSKILVEGTKVSKVFKDFWGRPKVTAVTDVNLRVPAGSVFGLLGPNGAGKSTLMKMILGHLYPTGGRLRIFGKEPTDVETKRRLGYLPERAYLYKSLTPEQTLRFFGQVLELPKQEIAARTDQLLTMVGLDHARKRLVGEFSHGMMRRVGLAQALLNDPDLLLLDEPTAGLDPIGCREVKNLLLTLAKRGKTIVLTSHLLSDVQDVSDQILIMYGGRVLATGPVQELLANKERLQLRLPALDDEQLRHLRRTLEQQGTHADDIEFSNPTRSLENYFLDVVREASTRHETQGARIGGGVATYLREGVQESPEELEAMTHARRGEAPAEEAAPPPDAAALEKLSGKREKPPAKEPEPEEVVDEATLQKLSGGSNDTDETESQPEDSESAVDQNALDALTRKKKR